MCLPSSFCAHTTTIAILIFLTTVADANICSAKQNQTLTRRASGADVVEAVVKKIQNSGIFPDDNGLLRRIAYVESIDGTHPDTYRAGYHGGIWQVDEIGFQDTQNIAAHPSLLSKFAKIKEQFGIDWTKVTWQDLRKPLYSGLAARLLLSNKPQPIPSSKKIKEQAKYWKKHYNGPGKGEVERFIEDVMILENMSRALSITSSPTASSNTASHQNGKSTPSPPSTNKKTEPTSATYFSHQLHV